MSKLRLSDIRVSIKNLITNADDVLRQRDQIREEIIKFSRNIIRESGYVITSIHTGSLNEADHHLKNLDNLFNEFLGLLRVSPELRHTGLVYNAESEYVEALMFYNIVVNNRIPDSNELRVDPVPLIQGLLDVIGELKRYALELAGKGCFKEAEEFFRVAEYIYEEIKPLEYPDALLPGVRRKLDIARSSIESLRALLIDLRSRYDLVNKLKELKK